MPNSNTFDVASIIHSLRNDQKLDLDLTAFIPYSLSFLKKERRQYFITALLITSLFLYLIIYAAIIDAYYYWHIDIYVIIGLLTIFLFLFIGIFFGSQTLKKHRLIQQIEQTEGSKYGIYLFDNLFIELRLNDHISFYRDQVNEIILCEKKGNDTYVEIQLAEDDMNKIIGFKTDDTHFDLVEWINQKAT